MKRVKTNNAKSMAKTIIIGTVLLMVICWGLLVHGGKMVVNEFSSAETTMKENVGTKVVLEGDTLTITDYTIIGKTYTLSSGVKVSAEYVEKNKVTP